MSRSKRGNIGTKDQNMGKYHTLLKGIAKSPRLEGARKLSATARWDQMMPRDRNREGMGTLHEHLHLAVIEYSKIKEYLETLKNDEPSRSLVERISESVREIQKHFGNGRDYMINFYLDRYSMNMDRNKSLDTSIKTVRMERLFRLEGIHEKLSKVSGDVPFSERVNRDIAKVDHIFDRFYAMVKHMNIPDSRMFK